MKNKKQVEIHGQKNTLYQDDNINSSPPERNLLYMDYTDDKGRARKKQLSKDVTPDAYIKKHGLKEAKPKIKESTNA